MRRRLLIATTNRGKFREISYLLHTLQMDLLSLADLPEKPEPPEESEPTLFGNALLKARYYAKKTGLLTLADDSGLFIDALVGWPGVNSARVGESDEARRRAAIEKVKSLSEPKRSAVFRECLALHDPDAGASFLATGETVGQMLTAERAPQGGFGYDPIFYLPELGKTYSELSVAEKNAVSHRGKALIKIKYHLDNTYGAKHIVVPYALIAQGGKVLMSQRREPHRPEYHGKWEFPGGRVEFGETITENLVREVKEEVGYRVEPVKLLQHIAVESQDYPTFSYELFLVPYVCRIVDGNGEVNDGEVMSLRWVSPDEILNYELVGNNAAMCRAILPELKETILELKL